MIDRTRLAELRRTEERRFVELHPRSAELAGQAGGSLLAGVPMPWMTRWPGRVPGLLRVRLRCTVGRRGRTGVRRPLPRRHRRDDGTCTPPGRRSGGSAGDAGHHDHAAVGGRCLGRRRARPPVRRTIWQLAMSATDADRFVLRFARHLTGRPRIAVMDWCYHGTVDETLAVLEGGSSGRPPARCPRSTGRRSNDNGCGAVQRPRGSRPALGRGRRRLPADGAGADRHRDRAPRGRLSGGRFARSPAVTAYCW